MKAWSDEFLAESYRRLEVEVAAYRALRAEEQHLRGRVEASRIMVNALRKKLFVISQDVQPLTGNEPRG